MAEVVTVTINGRAFRMGCDDGQEDHLTSLAAIVDEKIALFKGSYGEIGDTRLTVMASIMLADELNEAKKQYASKDREILALKEQKTALNEQIKRVESEKDASIETAAMQINALVEKLQSGGE
jgi:cell division protein ZapA